MKSLTLSIFSVLVPVVFQARAAEFAPLTLDSPLDYQVFQRDSREHGTIRIAGKLPAPDAKIEARIVEAKSNAENQPEWKPLAAKISESDFSAELHGDAGGWFGIEVRAIRNNGTLTSTSVDHVGIGEVFVVAGQSNSANHGSEKQLTQTGLVAAFSGTKWQLANDPQPGATGAGGSFMPAFGDLMVTRFHVPIGIVAVGVGSTSVREWLPKGERVQQETTTGNGLRSVGPGEWEVIGDHFANLSSRITACGPRGIRAILWHQGESDAGQARSGYPADRQISGEQYCIYMEKLIHATSKQAGWEIPWFTARVSYHSENDPSDDEFRAAQKSLWDRGVSHVGPDTDALRAEYRTGVHFNALGLQLHGRLWAESISPWLEKQLATTR